MSKLKPAQMSTTLCPSEYVIAIPNSTNPHCEAAADIYMYFYCLALHVCVEVPSPLIAWLFDLALAVGAAAKIYITVNCFCRCVATESSHRCVFAAANRLHLRSSTTSLHSHIIPRYGLLWPGICRSTSDNRVHLIFHDLLHTSVAYIYNCEYFTSYWTDIYILRICV